MRRLWKKFRDAVNHGPRESPSHLTRKPSPARNAETVVDADYIVEHKLIPKEKQVGDHELPEGYKAVSVPDAVAELSHATGDDNLDHIHEVIIDCLQHGYLRAVQDDEGYLRFGITPAGRDRVNRFFQGYG